MISQMKAPWIQASYEKSRMSIVFVSFGSQRVGRPCSSLRKGFLMGCAASNLSTKCSMSFRVLPSYAIALFDGLHVFVARWAQAQLFKLSNNAFQLDAAVASVAYGLWHGLLGAENLAEASENARLLCPFCRCRR